VEDATEGVGERQARGAGDGSSRHATPSGIASAIRTSGGISTSNVRAPVRALVVIARVGGRGARAGDPIFARRGRAGHQARVMLDDLRGQPRVAVTVDDHVTRRDRRQSAAPSEPSQGPAWSIQARRCPCRAVDRGSSPIDTHRTRRLRRLVVRIAGTADSRRSARGPSSATSAASRAQITRSRWRRPRARASSRSCAPRHPRPPSPRAVDRELAIELAQGRAGACARAIASASRSGAPAIGCR